MTDLLDAPLCLPPRPPSNRNNLRLPVLSCDSHFHVFAPDAALAVPRSYTPRIAQLPEWLALAETFGVARGVLVQPSVYGLDNQVLLAALSQLPDRLRGVVVIPPETTDAELERLDALGVRGVRFNLRNKSGIGFDAFSVLAPRIRALGWHAQFQIGPEAIATVSELTDRYDITGVIDHLAFIGPDTAGTPLDDLDRCLAGGRIYAKISAPYRLCDTPSHQFYRKALETLTVRYPDRLLWGSDWPHTELFETMPEDDDLIALSLDAMPLGSQDAIFAGNAQTLYFQH